MYLRHARFSINWGGGLFLLCLPVREVGHVQGHSYFVSGRLTEFSLLSFFFWKKKMESPNLHYLHPIVKKIPWEYPTYATGIEYFWLPYATCVVGLYVVGLTDLINPIRCYYLIWFDLSLFSTFSSTNSYKEYTMQKIWYIHKYAIYIK